MDGFQTHHKKSVERSFKFRDGKIAESETENAEDLKTYLSSLFNNQAKVDFSVVDAILNHVTKHLLGKVPTKSKIKKAISRMASNKAPGKTGLSTNMIKNLPTKALNFYIGIIQEVWKNKDIDFDSWHITTLNLL